MKSLTARLARVLTATLAVGLLAGAPAPHFAKIKPNKTKRARVLKVLGEPSREYVVHVPEGATPVHVPYVSDTVRPTKAMMHNPWDSPTGPLRKEHKPDSKEARAPEQMLSILEYPGQGRQPYYVVLHDTVVAYVIGPVASDERDPAAVARKWGEPTVHTETGNYGDYDRHLQVFAYPEEGVAFLKEPKGKKFVAKAVGLDLTR